jgi:hypothetical protein
MIIGKIEGKVFRTAEGMEYGVIRALQGAVPAGLGNKSMEPFAEDSRGNYFVLRTGFIHFWDHESRAMIFLAASMDQFVESLVEPTPLKLEEGQVKRVLTNSNFAERRKLKKERKP